MAEVNLTIQGRNYGVSCQDGQEQRVMDLAAYVDQRIAGVAQSGAASNENHLLVLTALMLSDEVFDLRDAANEAVSKVQQAQQVSQETQINEAEVAYAIDHLADRIDQIAKRIKAA